MKYLLISALAITGVNAADVPRVNEAAPPEAQQARTIMIHEKDTIDVYCRVHVPTMIALPEGEEALVVQGGDSASDKGSWSYEVAANGPARRYVVVKPSVPGSIAGLHVISSHNLSYTFMLHEASKDSGHPVDVSLFLVGEGNLAAKVAAPPVLVSAEQANQEHALRVAAEAERDQLKKASEAKKLNDSAITPDKSNYQFEHGKEPFFVKEISSDGISTHIIVDPARSKAAAVYTAEGKKNKPSIPLFDYNGQTGVYTIQGVVNKGWMQVSDSRMDFQKIKGAD